METSVNQLIQDLPKTELHVHLEGTFEPELMFAIAKRNQLTIPYQSVEEVKRAYQFNNLQEFLDIYYAAAGVLITKQDFYDLTWAYLERMHQENVVHVEVFFDPQTHTHRGVAFSTVISGITDALAAAKEKWGMTSFLIMCFLRHLDEEDAFATLTQAENYRDSIIAVGLDSSEVGHPPSKFSRVFAKSREMGFLTVAHAGEEGPPEYVWEAIDNLKVERVDHGNRSLEDVKLVKELMARKLGFTVCPLSNRSLKVVKDLKKHPLRKMLELGILATIHSDDPAYFGGYLSQNFIEITEALNLTPLEIVTLVKNSFQISFLDSDAKNQHLLAIEKVFRNYSDN